MGAMHQWPTKQTVFEIYSDIISSNKIASAKNFINNLDYFTLVSSFQLFDMGKFLPPNPGFLSFFSHTQKNEITLFIKPHLY